MAAYGTIAGWRAYALTRGDSAPTDASDGDATAALTRASDYVRLRYIANLLPGYTAASQPAGHDLPLGEEGAYIAASFELATPGFFSKTFTAAEQKVLTGAGSIKWTVVGEASGTYAASPSSTLLDALFVPYVMDRDRAQFSLRSVGC